MGAFRPGGIRRAARWDGWIAVTTADDRLSLGMPPSGLAERVELARATRREAGLDGRPFDVAVFGVSGLGGFTPADYEAVGATWWLESVDAAPRLAVATSSRSPRRGRRARPLAASIRPARIVTTAAGSQPGGGRWVSTSVVRPAITGSSAAHRRASVAASRSAVGSSRTRIGASRTMARAIARRRRSPPLRRRPSSPIRVPSPSGRASTTSASWAVSSAQRARSSVRSASASARLSRIVASNRSTRWDDDGDPRPDRVLRQPAQLAAADPDLARRVVVEAEEQLDQGGLARPAGSDDREPPARRDRQRQAVDDVARPARVPEPEAVDLEPERLGRRRGRGRVHDLGPRVDDLEQPRARGLGRVEPLDRGGQRTDRLERRDRRQRQRGEQRRPGPTRVADGVDPDPQHDDRAQPGQQRRRAARRPRGRS